MDSLIGGDGGAFPGKSGPILEVIPQIDSSLRVHRHGSSGLEELFYRELPEKVNPEIAGVSLLDWILYFCYRLNLG